MVKGPDFANNIGKKIRDFFNKGYDNSFSASITGTDSSGENATIHCGAVTCNSFSLATNTRLNKENITASVNMDTRSGPCATIAFDKIVPGLKTIVSFNPIHENLGQMELRYEQDIYSTISTSLDLTSNPQVNFSGLITRKIDHDACVSIATDVLLNPATGAFTKYDMGCEFSCSEARWSLTLRDKLKIKTLLLFLDLDPQTTLYSACLPHGRRFASMDLKFGVQHKLSPRTSLKAHIYVAVNHPCGADRFRASISHEWLPNCRFTINGEFPLGEAPNVGVALSFML